jgi:anti-anti-sigma factor
MPTISIPLAAETAVIAVSGPLDILSSHLFADAIAVARVKSSVIVSFEACPYLDSTILSVIVRHARSMRERLVLLAPKDGYVRRLLEMCGLQDLLRIVSALPECLIASSAVRALV